MVNADTGRLSATGYVLSHGPMIRDLVEAAFVLGQYETYQVQLAKIEDATGLDFGCLKDFDPLGTDLDVESPFGQAVRRIGGPDDLRL
jgi:endonuclease G